MKPKLARKIVRADTAYGAGRSLIDLMFALSILGAAFVIGIDAGAFGAEQQPQTVQILYGAAVVLDCLLWLLIREIVHALFDLVDSALRATKLEE